MKIISKSPDETKAIGYQLGKRLITGDVVGLYGELGSGKTTFIKGIAVALGINERDIVSASFTIITEYNTNPPFKHIDLYRINRDSDIEDIGLWEQIEKNTISVIEWAEKVEDGLPEDAIRVYIKYLDENIREIRIGGKIEENWNNLQNRCARTN